MDDVPVKIVERYKPPPVVYQLPQSIANKLAQEPNYYNENPQFAYNFQLERNVLTQMECWRQVRQREREARQVRMERRKQERQRAIEAQQKEMLGAVQYPNAEELSSSSSLESDGEGDDDDSGVTSACKQDESRATNMEAIAITAANTTSDTTEVALTSGLRDEHVTNKSINSTQTSNFHNILQPTVLSPQFVTGVSSNYVIGGQTTKDTLNASKQSNVLFNYADFEYDNSSPFDNMELKTINDLDILAQVLHNTQLKESAAPTLQESPTEASNESEAVVSNENNSTNSAALTESKAVLEKINFNSLNECDEVMNIPKNNTHSAQPEPMSNNYNLYHMYSTNATSGPQPSQTFHQQQHQMHQQQQISTIQAYHMQQPQMTPMSMSPYVTQYDYRQHQQASMNVPTTTSHNNHNYVLTPYCNGHHQQQTQNYIVHHGTTTHQTQTSNVQYLAAQSDAESAALKSKSVPDILRELKSELLNSELRRSRNLSHNLDDNVQSQQEVTKTEEPSFSKSIYTELTAPARKLADRISSMGFPLERVAKVVHICGLDDKKIIEHLIPLSELMDLGFDESKISAALLKFDNNKDKALDYLIS